MIEFHAEIRWVHILAVLVSGALFASRGALVLAGASRLAMWAPLRYLSYTIDTVLLVAALMLMSMLKMSPIAQPWLGTKIVLLLVYIVLGSFALRRAPGRRAKAAFYVASLAVFVSIVLIARARHPLGPLLPLLG